MTATRFTMKAKPTNSDLQALAFEQHECLHATGDKVDDALVKIDDLGVIVTAMAHALHVEIPSKAAMAEGKLPRIKGRLGSVRPWQAAAVGIPILVGVQGLYKVIEPAAAAFFIALHHALMSAH